MNWLFAWSHLGHTFVGIMSATLRETFAPTDRTRLRRGAKRGCFDEKRIFAILDEALVCHVAFLRGQQPVLLPMAYARDGHDLLLHGSAKNGMLGALCDGSKVAVSVTLLDGLVFARSHFHHSMNYRSVVVFGRPRAVTGVEEKRRALGRLVDRLARGRSSQSRPPSCAELAATLVVALEIEDVSAKIREGGPVDSAEDVKLPYWAGVVPVSLSSREALAADDLADRATALGAVSAVVGQQKLASTG